MTLNAFVEDIRTSPRICCIEDLTPARCVTMICRYLPDYWMCSWGPVAMVLALADMAIRAEEKWRGVPRDSSPTSIGGEKRYASASILHVSTSPSNEAEW